MAGVGDGAGSGPVAPVCGGGQCKGTGGMLGRGMYGTGAWCARGGPGALGAGLGHLYVEVDHGGAHEEDEGGPEAQGLGDAGVQEGHGLPDPLCLQGARPLLPPNNLA